MLHCPVGVLAFSSHTKRRRWLYFWMVVAMVVVSTVAAAAMRVTHARGTVKSALFGQHLAFLLPPRLSTRQIRSFQSLSNPLCAKFAPGDSVQLLIENQLVNGVVKEHRGSGWFSVNLEGDDQQIVKCRGSQLSRPIPINNPIRESISNLGILASDLPSPSQTIQSTSTQQFFHSTPDRPVIYAEMGETPNHPPPAPTMVDLDAMLLDSDTSENLQTQQLREQVQHHSKFTRWVVFTDLHCSPATLDTCLQVLQRVHELAVERDAGVLFLGDFWHLRGSLRVDCLNAILDHLSHWKVPMVMIPGNHDQVTLGGHNHGLTPIQNAYRVGNVPGPLVLSFPTKFRNALFVPHIRDTATLESVLQSPMAGNVSTFFVHADVSGAMMNDLVVSQNGVSPASFPSGVQVYSGHFHKPHLVKTTNGEIEYVGSPYEVSLSEAQQAKKLVVLDENWKCVENIPIDIGRRHFKLHSWDSFLSLMLENDGTTLDNASTLVRPGDRIVASIPKGSMEVIPDSIDTQIKLLRKSGVKVEIREVAQSGGSNMGDSSPTMDNLLVEDLTPESAWRQFLTEEGERSRLSPEEISVLVEKGLDIVNELGDSSEGEQQASGTKTDLVLETLSIEGFGPFRESFKYPLANRGLVLLKGSNQDGGSDSNGSGKSSLAMATLWALTGSLDPRRVQDAKVADVIHDQSKTARVSLEGTINGENFAIRRSKSTSSSSKGNLLFFFGGVDLTAQSIKETQAILEEKLGINSQILSRTMFHGQHDMNELLVSTDTQFKEVLSLLVPLKLWQGATTLSRAKSRAASKSASEFSGMISLRTKDLDVVSTKKLEAAKALDLASMEMAQVEAQFGNQTGTSQRDIITNDMDRVQTLANKVSEECASLARRRQELILQRTNDLGPLKTQLDKAMLNHDEARERIREKEKLSFEVSIRADSAKDYVQQIEEKWNTTVGEDTSIVVPPTCPTCHQPISSDESDQAHQRVHRQMFLEFQRALQERNSTSSALEEVGLDLANVRQEFKDAAEALSLAESSFSNTTASWDMRIGENTAAIQAKSQEKMALSDQLAALAKSQMLETKENPSLETKRAALEFSKRSHDELEAEWKSMMASLDELQKQERQAKQLARTMSELSERFGQRGIQAFLLRNAVDMLNSLTQSYLDALSDGCQRLRLELADGDRISISAFVCGADGEFKQRPLSSLSGGQWRRCSLALAFGFGELVARRGLLSPSLLVLDEPLTHLDQTGRANVGKVIRSLLGRANTTNGPLGMTTILLILQDLAADELGEDFDCVDEVIKVSDQSYVKLEHPFL
eukprot:Nitzschia sp. Nitz4//scaffold5_size260463//147664//151718//NITZ4_000990-RA/size260463-snap-gene-0.13-mRNA-1//1//CDS//3329555364//6634//frame0